MFFRHNLDQMLKSNFAWIHHLLLYTKESNITTSSSSPGHSPKSKKWHTLMEIQAQIPMRCRYGLLKLQHNRGLQETPRQSLIYPRTRVSASFSD